MPNLVVLSGPSGVGKSSVIARSLQQLPNTWLSVSATTRLPRAGEVEGQNYFFVDGPEFDRMAGQGEFLEWAQFAGNRYGTPRGPVQAKLDAGVPVLLEVDVQGAMQVREAMSGAVLVFLAPPDVTALHDRLAARGTENPEQLAARLAAASGELAAMDQFDHVIVNEDVERAAAELVAYLG
jgi:guanylate kinase